MARIAGVNLPNNKRIEVALTYIYGIGRVQSSRILNELRIEKDTRTTDLDDTQVNELRKHIENNVKVEGELRREKLTNIKRLKEIASYRGSRHSAGLPARGQRTKTNSRSVRGNKRRTAGSGKKTSNQKT
jgi:small subunit ribosomal protein S13